MFDYFWFWVSKALAEMAIGLAILCALGLIIAIPAFLSWVRQSRCKHPTFYESRQCDAICITCRKNLGHISTVRNQRAKKEEKQ